MRTKLFFAFISIVCIALLSNIVFEKLIIRDFNDYLKGTEEDHIYWVMASVEGSYDASGWNMRMLNEALHWGLMLGLDSYVEDMAGSRILSTADAIQSMQPGMKKRMAAILNMEPGIGAFTWYPLYVQGEELGRFYVRPLERFGLTAEKEKIFRKRGREFLVASFIIAGGGALLLSVLFTIFLSNPLRRLTAAAEKIARGDFDLQKPALKKKRHADEIDRLTGTFNYMAEALRREDALRKHLSSNVAHELRTPLTIIKGNLEAVEDGVITDTREIIPNITSEIERLIALVEGIEDVTSAEASFFEKGSPQEIELSEFIGSIAGGIKNLFEEKGLYIVTDGIPLTVNTYPEKLHIILKNLLTNAYKHTSKGGVRMGWAADETEGKGGFRITVEDTGAGISSDDLPHVFERFFKGNASAGRGLGLAIAKELAEVMGGRITVESEEQKGSVFTLIF